MENFVRHNPKCLKLFGELITKKKSLIMLKQILNLDGAQKLSKDELKTVQGGYACRLEMDGSYSCPPGTVCDWSEGPRPGGMCRTPEDIYG